MSTVFDQILAKFPGAQPMTQRFPDHLHGAVVRVQHGTLVVTERALADGSFEYELGIYPGDNWLERAESGNWLLDVWLLTDVIDLMVELAALPPRDGNWWSAVDQWIANECDGDENRGDGRILDVW